LFIDNSIVWYSLISYSGFLLSVVTIIHIYTSYRGFELLESGVAYTIFYLYPIMILLLSGQKINGIMIFAVIGVFLLVSNDNMNISSIVKSPEGLIMILLAAFTEAIIYFLVKDIKTFNNWNHIFISYFLGAVLLTFYFFKNIVSMKLNGRLSISLGINSVIGLVGYLLRFFAISRLDTLVYAPLSYFGIVMSFVYGFLNGDQITIKKIIGTALIILTNVFLL
jgi:drug/metabolite transporter (DMT)-like permease